MTDSSTRICPWCSSSIPAGASACPKCHAAVEGAVAAEIPGDSARADEDPFQPPTEAVRLEMRKMELEAQMANAGESSVSPTGDQAINVGRPSREAIDAPKTGLLDPTGPAGETDQAEQAADWEPRRG